MHFSSLCTAVALLAAVATATPVAPASTRAPAGMVIPASNRIQRLDASSNCLSPSIQALSGSNRLVLDSVARQLQASMFRDFHQFAPAAQALGNPDIEEKILGTDYTDTIAGLRELQELFKTSVPEAARTAGGSSDCGAPTAKNLRVISTNLDKLVQQFV
ncbi:hypothetical protein GGF37_006262 [Kickxella alabastrina]|nr:hypothetical protein GGF37_006262 [Kickxella alabastrina]